MPSDMFLKLNNVPELTREETTKLAQMLEEGVQRILAERETTNGS